ncbi:MAG TPA: C40 family peptidase [Bacteroidota bacterium]
MMRIRPLGNVCRRAALPAACALAVAAAGLAGCASTAPRFRAGYPAGRAGEISRTKELAGARAVKVRPWEDEPLPSALNRDHVLLEIVSLLGIPYEYGGADRAGMDCSAFTEAVYGSALRVRIPRSTADQYREGAEIGRDRLRFGDLVFFNTTGESPSHVGIYIEDDLFAHASVSYGVTISSMESPYYRDRFIGARRSRK